MSVAVPPREDLRHVVPSSRLILLGHGLDVCKPDPMFIPDELLYGVSPSGLEKERVSFMGWPAAMSYVDMVAVKGIIELLSTFTQWNLVLTGVCWSNSPSIFPHEKFANAVSGWAGGAPTWGHEGLGYMQDGKPRRDSNGEIEPGPHSYGEGPRVELPPSPALLGIVP